MRWIDFEKYLKVIVVILTNIYIYIDWNFLRSEYDKKKQDHIK